MNLLSSEQLHDAVTAVQDGHLIAYPTEAVFGFGCNPYNDLAIKKILTIKKRSAAKGLIVVAANFLQLKNLIASNIPRRILERALQTWPGPYTWLFPPKKNISYLLTGEFATIAVRVSAHPTIQQLCIALDSPIVSTSANISGEPSLKEYKLVCNKFSGIIDYICPGAITGITKPTIIRDLMTGETVRD